MRESNGRAAGAVALAAAAVAVLGAAPPARAGGRAECQASIKTELAPLLGMADPKRKLSARQKLIVAERWPWTTAELKMPVVERGWRDVGARSVRLAIRADGVMYIAGRSGFRVRSSEIVTAADLTERLVRAVREDGSGGAKRITIVADRTVLASVVVDAARRAPAGVAAALVVGKPVPAVMKQYRKVARHSPAAVDRGIEKALDRERNPFTALASQPELLAELRRSFGECQGLREAWASVGQGMGPDRFVPQLTRSLEACLCLSVDLPTMASIMIFVFEIIEQNGWIPLDAAALRKAAGLGETATVADLAVALTRR